MPGKPARIARKTTMAHGLIRLVLFGATLAATALGSARAEIVINVDQGATQPVPIAIPAFDGGAQASDIA